MTSADLRKMDELVLREFIEGKRNGVGDYWHRDSAMESLNRILTPPAPPVAAEALPAWMRDVGQVTALIEHLEGIGWRPDSKGDPECYDQGAAMSADVIRKVLLPLITKPNAAKE